jgi:hypothetical protein
LFVGVDFGVDEPGAVVERGVDEPIPGRGSGCGGCVAAAVDLPAATVGDPSDLLDVDVDELARPVALIAHRWLGVLGPVASAESGESVGSEDLLHRGAGPADLVADVDSTPPTLEPQLNDPTPAVVWCRVR